MRRLWKIAFLLLLSASLGLLALLSTHGGHTLLLRLASLLASSNSSALHIGALEGSLFGDGAIAHVTLSDKHGVWLQAQEISYSWTPRQLLSGRLDIASLRIGKISLLRRPVGPSSPAGQGQVDRATMQLPLKLRLGGLDVRQIDLGADVAGEDVKIRVTGSAEIEAVDEATAHFHIARLDGAGAAFDARIAAARASRSLTLAVEGSEPAGGFVAHLLGLPSRPPVSLRINGRGTLDAFSADLAVSAAGKPFIAGNVSLQDQGDRTHKLKVTAAGYFETLVPHAATELFAGRTDINLAADVPGLGEGAPRSVGNAKVSVNGPNLHIEATGGANLANLFVHGRVEGHARRADGKPIHFATVTGEGEGLEVGGLAFNAVLPETAGARRLTATAQIDGLAHPQFAARTMTMSMTALQPQPVGKTPSVLDGIAIDLAISGVDETLASGKALGAEGHAKLSGSYDGKVLSVSSLDVKTAAAVAQASGTLDGPMLKGIARVVAADLSRLSEIVGRPAKGRVDTRIDLAANLNNASVHATFEGESEGISTGNATADRLLAPASNFGGRIERSAEGNLVAQDVKFANAMLTAELDGKHEHGVPEVSGHVTLSSLAAIDPRLSGAAKLDVSMTGAADALRSALNITGERVTLNGRDVVKPSLRFSGHGPLAQHAGTLELSAKVAGEPIEGTAQITATDRGSFSIAQLMLNLAGAKLTGDVIAAGGKLPTGSLKIDAQSLARLGKATGMELQGRVTGDVVLADEAAGGAASVDIKAQHVVVGDLRVDGARANGKVSNYLNAPVGSIGVKVARASSGTSRLTDVGLEARFVGDTVQLASKGLFDGGTFDIKGRVNAAHEAMEIDVTAASYAGRSDLPDLRLSTPAKLAYGDGRFQLGDIRVAVGNGSLRVAGSVGAETVDTKITLQDIPASIAAVVDPGIGIEGNISGSATVTGAPAAPSVAAKIIAKALSARETRSRQLPPVDVVTTVTAAGSVANVGVRATGRGGLDIAVDGTVGMKGDGALDLSGKGVVPLALANVFLAERAARADGSAKVTARITGFMNAPRIDGSLKINGATASDQGIGLELSAIDADIGFTQEAISIRKLTAASKKGGSVAAEGSVVLSRGSEPSADVSIRLAGFKFGNQDPIAGEIDGEMTVSGQVSALVARGDINIKRMDITIPNQVPQSVALLDIRHVNAPGRIGADRHGSDTADRASRADEGVTLALDLHAADRIFVRGRGVDAQLGGDVKIRGKAARPVTDGQFTMSRGRLTIIGRQLDFSRGNIVFTGGLEPSLDMEAKADADGTTVIVIVSGPASKPTFKFTSSPELPEDEVVSLLLFNKSLAKLSATQLVQLASEIDKIGGLSSGPSTLDQLKSSLGIDVLDVTTDAKGNAQATAGSYLNEKTYVGVKQGTSLGTGRVVIDHNLTKNLKARGEVGSNGDSKLGLGFEWEY